MSKYPKGICFWERLCIDAGFQMIHDGQKNPGQFKMSPDKVKFYTRKYQGRIDGKPINTFVTFVYDEREAVNIKVSYKDGREKGELGMHPDDAKELISAKSVSETQSPDTRGNGGEGGQQDAPWQGGKDAARQAGQSYP